MGIRLLIVLHFTLAAALVLSIDWLPIPTLILLASSPGIILAVSAWLTMGLGRIRVHPTTTDQTILLTRGPYAVVRHPMYTGLIWFTGVTLFDDPQAWRVVAWAALVIVLNWKSVIEERCLADRFPDYTAYSQQVGRLVPNVFAWFS